MGRRKTRGIAFDLVTSPWQFSAGLAILAFVGIRWLLPDYLPERGPLAALKPQLASFSWIALAGLGTLSLAAAVRAPLERRLRARKQTSRQSSRQRDRMRLELEPDATSMHPAPATVPSPRPTAWTLEALRTLEWKRFELLCARYYAAVGFTAKTLDAGSDGGIDVKLYRVDPAKPLAIVQCKAWNTQAVGVKEIRELLGVMVHERVRRGIFVTTGTYSADAMQFAATSPIQLLDGPGFIAKIRDLPSAGQAALLDFAFEGDYRTPTCASCGVKMLARDSKRGPFWGCAHYPRCKNTLALRA